VRSCCWCKCPCCAVAAERPAVVHSSWVAGAMAAVLQLLQVVAEYVLCCVRTVQCLVPTPCRCCLLSAAAAYACTSGLTWQSQAKNAASPSKHAAAAAVAQHSCLSCWCCQYSRARAAVAL
jgi:hypothetical protein